MTAPKPTRDGDSKRDRTPYRQPRVADVVADSLRARILNGSLRDGDRLPKQEDLLDEFGVGRPSLRESLRILETEGLLTVQRGNQGGAMVHVPRNHDAAYTLGLILASQGVRIDDVGIGLREVEPRCAALFALRPDRATDLHELRRIHESAVRSAEEDATTDIVQESRHFHESIVSNCGNATLSLIVGALEALWSAHWNSWVESADPEEPLLSAEIRASGLEEHRQIIDLIEEGDPIGAARATAQHLTRSQLYAPLSPVAPRLEATVLQRLRTS